MHQRLYPVILCGGAGTRLWPASRPDRPKPFLRLTGGRSLFQDAVERVAPLATDGGELIIVAGVEHRVWVETQLAEIGRVATIILEPAGRDSAPAMAAAAAHVVTRDPQGVAVYVASDHHLPDADRFREAILQAAEPARRGHVVTLGVHPTGPSTAHGYILPAGRGLSPVVRFVEKPDRQAAARCLAEGYLWNSGNFIVGAATLLSELDRLAPEVARAGREALIQRPGRVIELSPAFRQAPSISIDHAVMEHTDRAWVLPVDFDWSDLGTWSAVAGLSGGGAGAWIGAAGDACLVRAAEGMVVATAGVSNLAVIAERDAVLVCDLEHAQEVKALVARIRAEHPAHEGATRGAAATPSESLASSASRFAAWMRVSALPLWATLGTDDDGRFLHGLAQDGRAAGAAGGPGVQAGQVGVYCAAGRLGWRGPWRRTVDPAVRRLLATDIATTPSEDQALELWALAGAVEGGFAGDEARVRAAALRRRLDPRYPSDQDNAPWLEACLAWETQDDDPAWRALSDGVASLALARFRDHGRDRSGEPHRQFSWAWLLTVWGRARGQIAGRAAALDLYRAGCETMAMAGGGLSAARLRAALILAEDAKGGERARLLSDARETLQALQAQLSPNGLWRASATVDGAASAASLRHIMSAYVQLAASAGRTPELAGCDLSLG